MSDTIPDELLESEGVVPTKKASASRLADIFCFVAIIFFMRFFIQIKLWWKRN